MEHLDIDSIEADLEAGRQIEYLDAKGLVVLARGLLNKLAAIERLCDEAERAFPNSSKPPFPIYPVRIRAAIAFPPSELQRAATCEHDEAKPHKFRDSHAFDWACPGSPPADQVEKP